MELEIQYSKRYKQTPSRVAYRFETCDLRKLWHFMKNLNMVWVHSLLFSIPLAKTLKNSPNAVFKFFLSFINFA